MNKLFKILTILAFSLIFLISIYLVTDCYSYYKIIGISKKINIKCNECGK